MASVRSVAVPPQFADLVSSSNPDALAGLSSFTRSALDNGEAGERIVGKMAEVGWERSFAAWYVDQAAMSSDAVQLLLPFVAYPREKFKGVYAESAEDLVMVTHGYRLLNWSAVSWVGGLTFFFLLPALTAEAFNYLSPLFFLYGSQIVCLVLAIVAAAKCSKQLGMSKSGVIVIGIVVALIPCGILMLLASLSARLNAYMKKAGVKVGLMGPNPDSLRAAINERAEPLAIPWRG